MEIKNLHSLAVIAVTAAAMALTVPSNAQGRRPGGGGGFGGGRPSSSQSSSPRSSSSSSSSSPRSSSPSMSSPRSSSPSMSSPRSSSGYNSRPSSPSGHVDSRPSNFNNRPSTPSGQVNNRPSSPSGQVNNRPGNFNSRPSGGNNGGGMHGGGNSGGNRPSGGNNNRPGFNRSDAVASPGAPTVRSGSVDRSRPSGQVNGSNNRPGGNPGGNHGGQPGGNMGGGNHRPGGNMGGGNHRPGGNMGGGNHRPGGNPGGNMGHRPPSGRPHGGINHGGPRPDYNRYRWHDSFRPRGPHDRWYDHYRYNRWSWRAPIAPPHRLWRPRVIWYYRPVIPTGYRIYASAPLITGILGLEFGTLLDASLNYLYYNGYSIDGYQDNVVYLRDVNMMGYSWPDVMLQYNDAGGLCYAEFVTSSSYRDDYRFQSLYDSLCASYGTPISNNGYYSWYGGNQTGFINLNFSYDDGRYYTVMTFGA